MREDDMLRIGIDASKLAVRGQDYSPVLARGVSQILDAAVGLIRLETRSDPPDSRATSTFEGCRPVGPLEIETAVRNASKHPLFRRQEWLQGKPHAARVSDHVDLGLFRETDLYRTMHGPLDSIGKYPAAVHLGRVRDHGHLHGIDAITRLKRWRDACPRPSRPRTVGRSLAFRSSLEQATRTITGASPAASVPPLTSRECVVLGLVARGWTNVHIGHYLRISSRTVRKHLENINHKLGTTNRAAAVNSWRNSGRN